MNLKIYKTVFALKKIQLISKDLTLRNHDSFPEDVNFNFYIPVDFS